MIEKTKLINRDIGIKIIIMSQTQAFDTKITVK